MWESKQTLNNFNITYLPAVPKIIRAFCYDIKGVKTKKNYEFTTLGGLSNFIWRVIWSKSLFSYNIINHIFNVYL
jgi:hypothetical protein